MKQQWIQKRREQLERRHNRELEQLRMEEEIIARIPHDRYVEFIHAIAAYGDGGIRFGVSGLVPVWELMEDYPPVPLRYIKRSCTVIYPEPWHDKMRKEYQGEPFKPIAPFWIKLNKIHGQRLHTQVHWYSWLPGDTWDTTRPTDLLIHMNAEVYGGEVPQYSNQGYSPKWAHLTYDRRTSYGEPYCTNVRAHLDLPPPRPSVIRWASGSSANPNEFTFYWPNLPGLAIDNIIPQDGDDD